MKTTLFLLVIRIHLLYRQVGRCLICTWVFLWFYWLLHSCGVLTDAEMVRWSLNPCYKSARPLNPRWRLQTMHSQEKLRKQTGIRISQFHWLLVLTLFMMEIKLAKLRSHFVKQYQGRLLKVVQLAHTL